LQFVPPEKVTSFYCAASLDFGDGECASDLMLEALEIVERAIWVTYITGLTNFVSSINPRIHRANYGAASTPSVWSPRYLIVFVKTENGNLGRSREINENVFYFLTLISKLLYSSSSSSKKTNA
jgi:hypothetical protein